MSSLLPDWLNGVYLSAGYNAVTSRLALAAIILLAVLFLERDLVGTAFHQSKKRWSEGLSIPIAALFYAFSVIIVLRFLSLLIGS